MANDGIRNIEENEKQGLVSVTDLLRVVKDGRK